MQAQTVGSDICLLLIFFFFCTFVHLEAHTNPHTSPILKEAILPSQIWADRTGRLWVQGVLALKICATFLKHSVFFLCSFYFLSRHKLWPWNIKVSTSCCLIFNLPYRGRDYLLWLVYTLNGLSRYFAVQTKIQSCMLALGRSRI